MIIRQDEVRVLRGYLDALTEPRLLYHAVQRDDHRDDRPHRDPRDQAEYCKLGDIIAAGFRTKEIAAQFAEPAELGNAEYIPGNWSRTAA